jgi:hypothetical protein
MSAMIRNVVKRLLGVPTGAESEGNHDLAEGRAAQQLGDHVAQATAVQAALGEFVAGGVSSPTCISLGQNCSTAWYLKQVGLKTASHPFDWIFSSNEIVMACIEDRFETYLDRSHIEPSADGHSAGHSRYHANMFNHRNPLASADDYAYYERCCKRFLDALDSDADLMFLVTLVNEPDKRVDWAEGFRHEYALPRDQTAETCAPLIERIAKAHERSRFVVIEHLTERTPRVACRRVDDRVLAVEFDAAGKSSGVYYPDALDDFCAKLVFTGLR